MVASLQHGRRSFRVRHVRIELTSSGFRVRRPSNEHMAQTSAILQGMCWKCIRRGYKFLSELVAEKRKHNLHGKIS